MQNPREDRDLETLLAKIQELNLQVDLLVTQRQEKGSPTSVARPFSPPLSPPKPTESPTTPSERKSISHSTTANPCARTQVIREGLFTPPSSPEKNKKNKVVSSPYSKIGPN
jgi:hypothetical protein